jgi:hypothetical protein
MTDKANETQYRALSDINDGSVAGIKKGQVFRTASIEDYPEGCYEVSKPEEVLGEPEVGLSAESDAAYAALEARAAADLAEANKKLVDAEALAEQAMRDASASEARAIAAEERIVALEAAAKTTAKTTKTTSDEL